MSLPYVELHAHSAFSFGDGASAPEELARSAAELGHEALALTDHDGVWGAMEFAQACKTFGVRPIVGCELTVTLAGAGDAVPEDQRRPAATSEPEPGGNVAEGEAATGVIVSSAPTIGRTPRGLEAWANSIAPQTPS